MKLSIIIPVLNENDVLELNLKKLQWVRQLGHEVIVVDGGSQDKNAILAKPLADQVLSSLLGRALQMNMGASSATGDVFLFLHIDTFLPADGIAAIIKNISQKDFYWGRFDVQLSGQNITFRVIERMMNWRSRLTSIATGDQAIFISRNIFEKIGGFPNMPLMEDVEISHQLKKITKPICLSQKVVTSSRRWEQRGIFNTMRLMWRLRFAYWLGSDPDNLARQYRSSHQ